MANEEQSDEKQETKAKGRRPIADRLREMRVTLYRLTAEATEADGYPPMEECLTQAAVLLSRAENYVATGERERAAANRAPSILDKQE